MDASRNGNFTSSEIAALLKEGTEPMSETELAQYKIENPKGKRTTKDVMFGASAKTYIEECNMERRLGRALDSEATAKPLSWGKLGERRVFDILGISYKESSVETICHKEYDYWLGSPDGEKFDEGKTVAEVKCPWTLKSFCQFIDSVAGVDGIDAMNKIREVHSDGEKYYWQIVSNSILLNAKYAELIIYMPYKSELDEIRILASNMPVADLSKYYGLANSSDNELPYLIDGGHYKNINVVRFEVPQDDKDKLTARVIEAGKLLVTV